MAQFMKTLAIILLVLMLAASLALGNMLAAQTRYATQYNWAVFWGCLLSSSIIFGLLYSVGCILKELSEMRAHLLRLNETNSSMAKLLQSLVPEKKDENENAEKPEVSAPLLCTPTEGEIPVYLVDRSIPHISCPACGDLQKSDRSVCFRCGAMFIDKEQERMAEDTDTNAVPPEISGYKAYEAAESSSGRIRRAKRPSGIE